VREPAEKASAGAASRTAPKKAGHGGGKFDDMEDDIPF
jgi:hypothetical protein